MKKILIALVVIIALVMVAFGGAIYYVSSKARSFFGPLQQYAALDKNVRNTSPFKAPSNGELTEDAMKRFAAVQESMTAKLGPTFNELKLKQDGILKQQQTEHRQASASEDFSAVSDLMKFIVLAKTAQVDALNQQRFSIDEYYWVRNKVYAAAGMSIEQVGLGKLTEALKQSGALNGNQVGDTISREIASNEIVPDRNKAIVEPYLPKLKDWAVFAFFGL